MKWPRSIRWRSSGAHLPKDLEATVPSRRPHTTPAVRVLTTLAAAACLLCGASDGLAQGVTHEFTPDGAWCWYSAPRAIYHNDTVYTGWVTRDGDIQVAEHGLFSGVTSEPVTLWPQFEADDHVHPVMHVTSDGRLTAFYSKHAMAYTRTQFHISINPWDITSWHERQSTNVNTIGSAGATYANPITMPGESDKVLLFWRGGNYKPNYSIGTYTPESVLWHWSPAKTLIMPETGRPYVRYAASGDDRIAFAFTNGHPSESDAKLYYASIGETKDGPYGYFRSDGSLIRLMDDEPLQPSEADVIYNGAQSPPENSTEAWIWDLAIDGNGRPTVVFASFPSKTQHRYHWARYEDGQWFDRVLVEDAGGSVADTTIGNPQYYYSGGITLDHTDTRIVYLSRENEQGGWDLEQWKTPGDGSTWMVTPITSGSPLDNMRPAVPAGRPAGTEMVLWMSGRYDYYKNPDAPNSYNFDTGIYMWVTHQLAGIEETTPVRAFALRQCKPNPTAGATEIAFDLQAPAHVSLDVHDVAGRLVANLLRSDRRPGGPSSVVWDATDQRGHDVSSGVYFIRLSVDGQAVTSKVVVAR